MSAAATTFNDEPEILLVLRSDGVLLPVYEPALQVAEGWPWTIKRSYKGALLIRSSGAISKIHHVTVDRPYGKSLLARIFSVLNSNWMVTLHLERAETASGQVKQAVLHGLQLDRSSGMSLFEGAASIPESSSLESLSIAEIFAKLQLNGSHFVALDSL